MPKLENLDGMKVTRTASADLVGPRFVKENAGDDTKIDQCGNNENALGLICVSPKENEVLTVDLTGVKPVEAGAAVAVGDEIISDASGRGIPREDNYGTVYRVLGRALSQANAEGEQFSILLNRYSVYQS